MSERPTPETDALVLKKQPFGGTDYEWIELSRRLERERNEARKAIHIAESLIKPQIERERDEARNDLEFRRELYRVQENYLEQARKERDELKKIVEQRILAGAEIHDKANSLLKQNDKTEAECEYLRKQLTAATSALRQIHLEVGDWIRSTIIVEE